MSCCICVSSYHCVVTPTLAASVVLYCCRMLLVDGPMCHWPTIPCDSKQVMNYAMKMIVICVASRKLGSLHGRTTERWRGTAACQRSCGFSSSLGLSRISRNSNIATEIRGRVFARFALWGYRFRISARKRAVVRLFHKFLSPSYQRWDTGHKIRARKLINAI